MINKKGEILALKIIGAATGATGFVVLGVSSNTYAIMIVDRFITDCWR